MTPVPLTEAEQQAAAELRRGVPQREVGQKLGGSTSKVKTLMKRDDFRALVEPEPEAARSVPASPAVRPSGITEEEEVLEMAMRVKGPSGNPTSLATKAAMDLAKLRAAKADERTAELQAERIYVAPTDPDHDSVVKILDTTPADESVFVVVAARNLGADASGARVIPLGGSWWPSQPEAPTAGPDTPPTDEAASGPGQ